MTLQDRPGGSGRSHIHQGKRLIAGPVEVYDDRPGPSAGFEEMDEVSGTGTTERTDGGSINIEFSYHLGNEAQLKARRW